MTTAEAILTDLLADKSEWWAGELQTVTGYYFAEYQDLAERIQAPGYSITKEDRKLLFGAGMGLIYSDPPALPAKRMKSMFGEDWITYVEEFMQVMDGRKWD